MYNSMENLRYKRGEGGGFTSRKQLANVESYSCIFFSITKDTRVNSDWAKTIIVTFVLKIINSKVCPRPRSH